MFLPILDVNVGNTTNQEFKLSLIEDVHKVRRDELVEPGDEGVELLLDTLLYPPFGDET